MRIILGADIVPTSSNELAFEQGDVATIINERLLNLLDAADYRIFNLEVPLTDQDTPISKCGPNLKAPTKTVAGLKKLGIDLFTLANNHILDQGEQGLHSTENVLRENKIAYLGVGDLPEEAAKPYILEAGNKKIGIYACAEHEFSLVSEHNAGANPFDPLESPDHVVALKAVCDYVIVLYHGGKEHYRYPSPELRKVCRKMVDKGADLILCQHSHCIGCEEQYHGGTIVYGQGNFLFDYSSNECWKTGLLLEIRLDNSVSIVHHPVVKAGNGVKLAVGDEKDTILRDFWERSDNITDPRFIEEQYDQLADQTYTHYVSALYSKKTRRIWFKVLYKLTGGRYQAWYAGRKLDKESRLAARNYLECEAHRELFARGLERKR